MKRLASPEADWNLAGGSSLPTSRTRKKRSHADDSDAHDGDWSTDDPSSSSGDDTDPGFPDFKYETPTYT